MPEVRRRSWKHFFYSNLFLGLVVVFLAFVSINLLRLQYQNRQVDREIERLQSDVKRLETKKIETLEALKFVESSSFIEEKARLQFNVVKPGESVAIVSGIYSVSSSNTAANAGRVLPPWKKWLRIFIRSN